MLVESCVLFGAGETHCSGCEGMGSSSKFLVLGQGRGCQDFITSQPPPKCSNTYKVYTSVEPKAMRPTSLVAPSTDVGIPRLKKKKSGCTTAHYIPMDLSTHGT